MRNADLQPVRLAALVVLAIALGLVFLQLDPSHTLESATAATSPQPAASTNVSDSGLLVASDAAPAADPAPAPAPADPSDGGAQGAPGPAPTEAADPEATRRRGGVSCAQPHRVIRIGADAAIHATPAGRRIGTVPMRSAYLGSPMYAWVQAVSDDGRWGKVTIPWTKPVGRTGWIRIDDLEATSTRAMAVADLSDRSITIYRDCRAILRVRSAIGRPGSPSPTGRFWVTDRVVVPTNQRASFGSFAFGLSTVQPNLPPGWSGGDQMAIHGTGAPGSIGQAASAGCLRVTEDALRNLKPLLRLGTPIVIQS